MEKARKARKGFGTADLAYMAIGAALIAVCSWISIPAMVPFTLQTFGVFFVLTLLGAKRGTVSVLVYILLGAVGVPVFAGFTSGIGVLLGNTGGYIVGFLLSGAVYGLVLKCFGKKPWTEILGLTAGLAVCYALGTAWFMVVYARDNGPAALWTVLSWCVFPFVLPDLGKLLLAQLLAARIRPALREQIR